jgi:putative transposase
VLQQALKDVDSAFQHFFRRVSLHEKPGYPKFKRRGERDSFRYPQGFKVDGNHVYLPKIGMVRFKKTREIEGTIKQVTVIKEKEHWYVCFSCEIEREMPEIQLSEASAIGIDVGLTHYATLAKGDGNEIEEIENPRFLRRFLGKLHHLSKSLSRKKFKSKNWYKAKRELQDFHVHLKNCRKDFAHKLSTQIVKSHDIIGVESLSVALLMQSGQTRLARSIADAGWRQFFDCLTYKAKERGKALVPVDRWFASTQICSGCGKKNHLQLSDRVLRCECGLEIGRDVNSAINIKEEALAIYRAAGMSVLKLVELSLEGSCEARISRL